MTCPLSSQQRRIRPGRPEQTAWAPQTAWRYRLCLLSICCCEHFLIPCCFYQPSGSSPPGENTVGWILRATPHSCQFSSSPHPVCLLSMWVPHFLANPFWSSTEGPFSFFGWQKTLVGRIQPNGFYEPANHWEDTCSQRAPGETLFVVIGHDCTSSEGAVSLVSIAQTDPTRVLS